MNRQRAALVDRIESSGQDFLWNLEQLSDNLMDKRVRRGEWTVHQIAAHVRDVEQQVFLRRTQLIVRDERPKVENFDQERWNAEHYDPREPLRKIFGEFRLARRKWIRLLRGASKRDWSNWAVHPDYGRISLDWLALHGYNHTVEHIAQVGQLREQVALQELNGLEAMRTQ